MASGQSLQHVDIHTVNARVINNDNNAPWPFWLKPFWLKSNCGSSFTLQQCRMRVERKVWVFSLFVCMADSAMSLSAVSEVQ